MRGGDRSGGVSALEPHLAHTNTEQQPGRGPRRSSRSQSSSLAAAVNGGSHPNARTAEGNKVRNGFSANVASLVVSSIDPEQGGRIAALRVPGGGEEGVRAAMRGGDGAQVAHSIKESKRAPAKRSRAESSNLKRGSEGLVNGASSSMEPTIRSSPRAKKPRGRGANGVEKHGKSRLNLGGPSAVVEEEQQQPEPEGSPRERVGEYFPLVPDELGLQCLTRLPRSRIYEMAMVCRKWREYLQSPELYKARRLLGVRREDWVFILGTNVDKNWRAFRPDVGDWVSIPLCPSDYTFDSCDKESMVAGLNLLVLGQNKDGYVIWKFDTISCQWTTTPRMNTDRCMFGSATFGKYAYFAGGTSRGTFLKSVERYDSETNSWESLADMNFDRKACSGFVMDGKFYVIGGHVTTSILSSGEAYDPQTGTWTVIEGMWPQQFVPNTQVSPPLVAVLNNQLYAINIIHNMLMLYNKGQNSWQMLEKVPHRAQNTNGWGLGFKSVGDELFVIGGARGPGQFLPKIHAYRPRTDGGETWRHVTDLKIPTNGFIYNCAVMSG